MFYGFQPSDFASFSIEGLDARMEAIRERIQPKFRELGQALCREVAVAAGNDMHLHIAQHARRKINPPKDTWLALCHNKRGYKQHPHFQIGLFDDHVFIWFALIYELPEKRQIASRYLKHVRKTKQSIPDDYVLSQDHMKKDALPVGKLSEKQFKEALERFRDVKQAELLVGRHIMRDDPILQDGAAFVQLALTTFQSLMLLYKTAIQ